MINLNKFVLILGFYGDNKPHKLYEQFYWIKNINRKITDKEFLNIHKRLFENGLITKYGIDYYNLPLLKRQHILTTKGDLVYREIAIYYGGDYYYYKYYDRNPKKKQQ